MSGAASTSVAIGGGGDGGYGVYRPPFTAGQWQELEHQAMIYKYLVAGLPVPPDLVMPIRHSFDAVSARFFHHPSLGYVPYYGKKFDPEPGRCRRTDGKKWRCSKDAHPDSKYCERHMHRGRNRSRKPVESQSSSQPQPQPQTLPSAMTHISSSGSASNTISFQSSSGGSGSFQNLPLYSVEGTKKLQMDNLSYGVDSKDLRYVTGLGSDTSDQWRLMPKGDSLMLNSPGGSAQQSQQCFLGSEVVNKQEHSHSVHPFFSEWPSAKEPWSMDVDDGANKNVFSSTQLSISIPRASSDFSSRSSPFSQSNDG